MKRSSVPIVIALALAVLAGAGVFIFVRGAEDRALAQQQAVDVLVTDEVIPAGTTLGDALDRGLASQTQVSDKLSPPGAISSPDAQTQELLAVNDIPAGQVLLAADFAPTAARPAGVEVPDGMLAVSVVLEDPQKVGSFVRPGSLIAVFDTTQDPQQQGGEPVMSTRPLLDRVEVIAIGSTTGDQESTTGDQWTSTLVTVAVDQRQAEKLIHGVQTGKLYLALIGDGATLKPSSGVNDLNLFQ